MMIWYFVKFLLDRDYYFTYHSFMLMMNATSLTIVNCGSVQTNPIPGRQDVDRVLNDWHDAASRADEARYFGHMASNAVFLGTDAAERWTLDEFRKYVSPHFLKGQGWTYITEDRYVMFSEDGTMAWFDERLKNKKYGELRGTGVLRRMKGAWKIVHYSLVFTIPNEVALKVVELITPIISINRDK